MGPIRECLFDWLSITKRCVNDEAINDTVATTKAAVRAAFGYGDTRPLKRPGNFGEGEEFVRVGGSIRWTKKTMADINNWDHEGRCVLTVNLTLRGTTGLGRLKPWEAISFFMSLSQLGYDLPRRIDSTIDLYDHPTLSVHYIRRKFEAGLWKIPRRDPLTYFMHGPILQPDKGAAEGSLYLGPNSASSRVVIYNKGAQRGSERPWVRFENRSTREHALGLWRELLQLGDAIFESGAAERRACDFITSAVRGSADIYDISAFNDIRRLPKNWTRSPMAVTPPELDPVFAAVEPLDVGDLRIRGGYASAVRHMTKSCGRTAWKMCLSMIATRQYPGKGLLLMGYPAAFTLTKEDFEEMAVDTNIPPADLEAAELKAHNFVHRFKGWDIEMQSSDKTEVRNQLAVTLGGVQ